MDPLTLLEADRDSARERVARLREDFTGVLDASRDTNADDEHDPEGHTIGWERSQLGALLRQAEQHLDEVEAAVARVGEGTYGTCTSCGGPIAPGRLEARPTARTCISCAAGCIQR